MRKKPLTATPPRSAVPAPKPAAPAPQALGVLDRKPPRPDYLITSVRAAELVLSGRRLASAK